MSLSTVLVGCHQSLGETLLIKGKTQHHGALLDKKRSHLGRGKRVKAKLFAESRTLSKFTEATKRSVQPSARPPTVSAELKIRLAMSDQGTAKDPPPKAHPLRAPPRLRHTGLAGLLRLPPLPLPDRTLLRPDTNPEAKPEPDPDPDPDPDVPLLPWRTKLNPGGPRNVEPGGPRPPIWPWKLGGPMTGLNPPSLPRSSSSVDCVKPDTELSIDDDLPRVLDCGTTPKAVCRGGGKGAMCGMGAIEGAWGDIEVEGGHIEEGCD